MGLYGFKSRKMHGEAGAIDVESTDIQQSISQVKAKIAEYPPERVYNIDETCIFYKQVARKTISKESIAGLKVDKNRFTIFLKNFLDHSFIVLDAS